jgi:hypothetical protein
MSKFDLRTFANELNKAARPHPIGSLQEIRAELHNKKRSGQKIFTPREISKDNDWAFHHGGRKELQFNIGFDGSDGKMLRSGVAFSFKTSRTLPTIDVLIPKVKLFNDFLRLNPDLYSDMRMWHWQGDKQRSSESAPGPIPPELIAKEIFVFLGNRRLVSELNYDIVLDDMDRLLPLYKYVESNGRTQPLPNASDEKFVFRSGRKSNLTKTKASYAQKELDVNLRHNLLQETLYRQLVAEYGTENVHREVPTGNGNSVDVAVQQTEGFWFYEIKTFQSPRACVREAIGQLLEYAFWPKSQEACRLIIVGETAPDQDVLEYCRRLKQRFSLPVEYQQIVFEDV